MDNFTHEYLRSIGTWTLIFFFVYNVNGVLFPRVSSVYRKLPFKQQTEWRMRISALFMGAVSAFFGLFCVFHELNLPRVIGTSACPTYRSVMPFIWGCVIVVSLSLTFSYFVSVLVVISLWTCGIIIITTMPCRRLQPFCITICR